MSSENNEATELPLDETPIEGELEPEELNDVVGGKITPPIVTGWNPVTNTPHP